MASCPFCTWSDKSYRLPRHLITHHIKHVHLTQSATIHYVRAYYRHGGEDVNFCVCLTCHKGTMDDGFTGHGARWVALHAKKPECAAAHPEAMMKLRARMSPVTVPHITPPAPMPPKSDPIADLWNKCKENPMLQTFMNDIEEECKAEHYKQKCIALKAEIASIKSENASLTAEINIVKSKHEQERAEFQKTLKELTTGKGGWVRVCHRTS